LLDFSFLLFSRPEPEPVPEPDTSDDEAEDGSEALEGALAVCWFGSGHGKDVHGGMSFI
jgi:hypothetical protein